MTHQGRRCCPTCRILQTWRSNCFWRQTRCWPRAASHRHLEPVCRSWPQWPKKTLSRTPQWCREMESDHVSTGEIKVGSVFCIWATAPFEGRWMPPRPRLAASSPSGGKAIQRPATTPAISYKSLNRWNGPRNFPSLPWLQSSASAFNHCLQPIWCQIRRPRRDHPSIPVVKIFQLSPNDVNILRYCIRMHPQVRCHDNHDDWLLTW